MIIKNTVMTQKHELIESAAEVVERRQRSDVRSMQERFGGDVNKAFANFLNLFGRVKNIPPYSAKSKRRDKFLSENWWREPIWAGIIRTIAALDGNQGWWLIGSKTTVEKYRKRLQKHYVAPDRKGRRQGINAGSVAYHTQDLGWVQETEREDRAGVAIGPLSGFYHVISYEAELTGDMAFPLKVKGVPWARHHYMRTASLTNAPFNGLGICSTSIIFEMLQILMAVYQYDQERLLAKAPKGLLLMSGITEGQWVEAMEARAQNLTRREQEYFPGISILTSPSTAVPIEAKLVALSELPEHFNRKDFTELMVKTMANVVQRDPAEFWPFDTGTLGRGGEAQIQHRKAVRKARDFIFDYTDSLLDDDYGLPSSLHYQVKEKDDEGQLLAAEIFNTYMDGARKLWQPGAGTDEPLFEKDQIQSILVDAGVIPPEYTSVEEEAKATDVSKSRAKLKIRQEELMEFDRVRSCVSHPHFAEQPIVQYGWPENKTSVIWRSGAEAVAKKVWPVWTSGEKEFYRNNLRPVSRVRFETALVNFKDEIKSVERWWENDTSVQKTDADVATRENLLEQVNGLPVPQDPDNE